MSKLEEFLGKLEPPTGQAKPEGVEWFASVKCGVCNVYVDEQKLYPNDSMLVWTCENGHRGYIEGYNAF